MHPWPSCNGRTRNAVSMSMSMSIYDEHVSKGAFNATVGPLHTVYLFYLFISQKYNIQLSKIQHTIYLLLH